MAISKNIIHHRVTIVATIHRILVDSIIRALGWERNPVHETDDIINKRLSSLNQSSNSLIFSLVGKFTLANG